MSIYAGRSTRPQTRRVEGRRSWPAGTARSQFGGRRHARDEPVIEFLGRIVTRGLELGLKSAPPARPPQVAPRAQGKGDVRDVDTQDLDELLFEAEPVHIGHLVPGLQGDDEVHALFVANADRKS